MKRPKTIVIAQSAIDEAPASLAAPGVPGEVSQFTSYFSMPK